MLRFASRSRSAVKARDGSRSRRQVAALGGDDDQPLTVARNSSVIKVFLRIAALRGRETKFEGTEIEGERGRRGQHNYGDVFFFFFRPLGRVEKTLIK